MREAFVLAGGLGTRLRPVLPDAQKALAPVAGRPFIAYLLDRLAEAGVARTIVATGYRSGEVEAALGARHGGMELVYSPEPEPLGTGGALRLGLTLMREDAAFVLNGDSYFDAKLADFAAWYRAAGAQIGMAVARVEDASRFGRVEFTQEGIVTGFSEKSAKGPGYVNAGVYALTREAIERIPSGRAVSLERVVFPGFAGRGLYAYPAQAAFLDIGTPESYARAEAFFKALSR